MRGRSNYSLQLAGAQLSWLSEHLWRDLGDLWFHGFDSIWGCLDFFWVYHNLKLFLWLYYLDWQFLVSWCHLPMIRFHVWFHSLCRGLQNHQWYTLQTLKTERCVLRFLIELKFRPNSKRSHWWLWGHMTSNDKPVSRVCSNKVPRSFHPNQDFLFIPKCWTFRPHSLNTLPHCIMSKSHRQFSTW